MAYRNLFIQNPACISVKNQQLILKNEDTFSIPIEDINCILFENQHSMISCYTLAKLAQNGAAVLFCDEKHLPCSVLLPIHQHCRHLKMLNAQLNLSKPKIKNLWKQIVIAKIQNQARCLKFCHIEESSKLELLAKKVVSGDPTNIEATAAARYFKALFGTHFSRGSETIVNSALNYGYAIIRGVVARNLAVYGFEPSIGIHHHNELNPFNLADDLIEPFRPIVDLFVVMNIDEKDDLDLTPSLKHSLLNLLNVNIDSNGEQHSVSYAIEREVQSLSRCFLTDETKLYKIKIVELRQHRYE